MTDKDKILKRDYLKSHQEVEFYDRVRASSVRRQPVSLGLGIGAWDDYVVGFSSLRQLLGWYFGKRVLARMNKRDVEENYPNVSTIYWVAKPIIVRKNDKDFKEIEKIYSYTDEQLEERDKRRIEMEKINHEKGLKIGFIKNGLNTTYKDYLISKAKHNQRKIIDFLKNKDIKYYAVCKSRRVEEK